ncbi:MAG: NAD(P)-binding domain-containing protein [Ignavibacteriaceae bacterium]|nr:NAD(P)-binding domain-containing protein [Ignavibacteriaceae bacterium]
MSEVFIEELIIYGAVIGAVFFIFFFYLKRGAKKNRETEEKIQKAKEFGLYEPVSLHPVVNPDMCIGTAACIEACPEKDILGLVNGKASTINASRCVGHGACFHACPVQAISLHIGTEKRGVDLPHVSQEFETNVPMIFIAGELGGMGLIKNAVEQGKQAVSYLSKKLNRTEGAAYDIIIVGAGPAGISATLRAKELGLKFVTFEQDTLGGTVYSFPRAKIVMTSAMSLPLHGTVKLGETSKAELLTLWKSVLSKNNIKISEREKVESIERSGEFFNITTSGGNYTSASVLIAIGRRGTPRKLGVKGEEGEKVYYRLLEPELIKNKNVLVVGGGDSAIESAMLIADEGNNVSISYRGESFSRLKPKNLERIESARSENKVDILLNTTVKEILPDKVILSETSGGIKEIPNDLVYVFAGGELPNAFLEKTGIRITKKFGDAILKHS